MKKILFVLITLFFTNVAFAGITIKMYSSENGKNIGTVEAEDTRYGLLLTPQLHDLPPGAHGFHIHEKPSCADHAMAAGGHLDPEHTNKHLGPYDKKGHLGDLPVLIVDPHGNAIVPVLAP